MKQAPEWVTLIAIKDEDVKTVERFKDKQSPFLRGRKVAMKNYQKRVLNYLKGHTIKETIYKFDLYGAMLPAFCMSDFINIYSDTGSVNFFVDRFNKDVVVFSYSEAVDSAAANNNLIELIKNNGIQAA